MSSPIINPLALVDPQGALNPDHRLNQGRTMWLLALPQLIGTRTFYNIANSQSASSGIRGTLNLGAGTNGWKKSTRPGGWASLLLSSAGSDRLDLFRGTGSLLTSDLFTASDGAMACWVNWTASFASNTVSYLLPVVFSDGNNNYKGIFIGTIGGTSGLWGYIWDGGEKRVSAPYTIGTWARVVWTHSAGILSLYVNGVLGGSIAAGNIASMGNTMLVGIGADASFDDVTSWNRGLSAAEVLEDYEESIAGYPTVLNRASLASLFAAPPPLSVRVPWHLFQTRAIGA